MPRSQLTRRVAALAALLGFVSMHALADTAALPAETPEPIVGAGLPGLTLPVVETRPAPAASSDDADVTAAAVPAPSLPDKPLDKTVTLVPGVNEVISIAKGHLNRIVTPFEAPVVHTTSTAKISTEGNVLYVASQSESPSTLYVSPKGQRDLALSITLLPRAIPPREVRLAMEGDSALVYASSSRAGEWEREQPYVETLKSAVRHLALGEVPPGYGLRAWSADDMAMACAQPGIRVEPRQVLPGSDLILMAGVATNTSTSRIEINEASCRRDGVLAVAAWPEASLAAGESTEIYVVTRRPAQANEARQRPSLIGTRQEVGHE